MPPKCPYCNETLDYDEQINDGYSDDYYYIAWRGVCSQCNKVFYWNEIYKFSYYENLEEEKELE